ncbi:MAG TPA: prenyltransferase/squalene oxidase repeat-containing protein [Vicinamibacterales bacterium]|nr:prenyltransferase/squalene oxidase repeat-containing protein [Vicinamibacterales bacterium]
MTTGERLREGLEPMHRRLVERLLEARTADGHWVGALSSSALSTATASIALASARQSSDDIALAERGLTWLAVHQNADGGWGDTTLSVSNISTTALCWAALAFATPRLVQASSAVSRCEAWLTGAAGGLQPTQLRNAIVARYGNDRTFSAPILTTLALAGRLGSDGWRHVPQLPFELAACPPRWFQWLQLPVVSYALPALIAIGQVRHHRRPSRNLVLRGVRSLVAESTRITLRRIQPSTGGYLEATPLTSFVVMSLAGMNQAGSDVAAEGLRFLRDSIRDDGSWPIDTNLATWVTTLSINAFSAAPHRARMAELSRPRQGDGGPPDTWLSLADRAALAAWLIDQQHLELHPYTQARPGGWAWTPLPGGVPDADDTAGALLALHHLDADPRTRDAVAAGVEWLLHLQNRDGGIPTFCRGWGTLPFDRSTPDLTAHALRAWHAWRGELPAEMAARVDAATTRALEYLGGAQRPDGAWIPLWFGNQHAPDDVNATYGTCKVVLALAQIVPSGRSLGDAMRARGVQRLVAAQNSDGGWGGDVGVRSSIEETAFAVEALAAVAQAESATASLRPVVDRGVAWLATATEEGVVTPPSPIGLYFAKLWYFEALYPLIFATAALSRVQGGAAR